MTKFVTSLIFTSLLSFSTIRSTAFRYLYRIAVGRRLMIFSKFSELSSFPIEPISFVVLAQLVVGWKISGAQHHRRALSSDLHEQMLFDSFDHIFPSIVGLLQYILHYGFMARQLFISSCTWTEVFAQDSTIVHRDSWFFFRPDARRHGRNHRMHKRCQCCLRPSTENDSSKTIFCLKEDWLIEIISFE